MAIRGVAGGRLRQVHFNNECIIVDRAWCAQDAPTIDRSYPPIPFPLRGTVQFGPALMYKVLAYLLANPIVVNSDLRTLSP